jgi:hypothetical protein
VSARSIKELTPLEFVKAVERSVALKTPEPILAEPVGATDLAMER